jgi:hypothetical protein
VYYTLVRDGRATVFADWRELQKTR